MLTEKYYLGPGFLNPDFDYSHELSGDLHTKLFLILLDEVYDSCATVPCPSIQLRRQVMSVQSACLRYCTAKTSFTAPPDWVLKVGGTLATIQMYSRCSEFCCVQEIYYRRDASCNYIEVARFYSLKDEYGVVYAGDINCPIDNFLYPCFWDNNPLYIQGTNSPCRANCQPTK